MAWAAAAAALSAWALAWAATEAASEARARSPANLASVPRAPNPLFNNPPLSKRAASASALPPPRANPATLAPPSYKRAV